MPKLAIFSTPKPFTDPHIAIIQENAIRSWKALGEDVEIWLVGEEEGVSEAALRTGVHFIADVERTSSGTPRIDSIFSRVRQASHAQYLCYVNADILFFPDLLSSLDILGLTGRDFLSVGQRWDMNVQKLLEIQPGWETDFLSLVKREGKQHPPAGSDYFLFPRELFQDIPPFAVGRVGWDNWMIFHGRQHKIDVVNTTHSIMAVHQNHDFKHLPGGKKHRRQPESLDNISLAGGRPAMFTLADTNKRLLEGKLVAPAISVQHVLREISICPLINIRNYTTAKRLYRLMNPLRVYQDKQKEKRMKKHIEQTVRETQ